MKYLDKIEEFFCGKLEGSDLEQFITELNSNPEFRNEFEIYKKALKFSIAQERNIASHVSKMIDFELNLNHLMDIKQFKEVKSVDRNRETFIEILKAENEEFMKRNILKSKIIKSLKIAACIFLTFGLCIMGIILIPKYAYNNEKLFEKFYSPFQYPFVTRSTSKEISIPIVNALSFYIEGDYNNAISELSSVDDSLIFDDAIFIIKGISFIELEKYDLAIEKLKLVDENSLLYSSALWYQGLCNLKINEKKAAKQIFNKLLSIDPCYQKKSKKLLRFL